jgi:hypothetical protein
LKARLWSAWVGNLEELRLLIAKVWRQLGAVYEGW